MQVTPNPNQDKIGAEQIENLNDTDATADYLHALPSLATKDAYRIRWKHGLLASRAAKKRV